MLADASFVMVIVSVVWVIVNCIQKGFPALNQDCALPVGCTPDYEDYGGECDSCFGRFEASGFVSSGELSTDTATLPGICAKYPAEPQRLRMLTQINTSCMTSCLRTLGTFCGTRISGTSRLVEPAAPG